MTKSEKLKHCSGCYDDHYNIPGNTFSGDCCWSLETMKLIKRKEIHISQVPPWNQKPRLMPKCYHKPQYVYVEGDRKS